VVVLALAPAVKRLKCALSALGETDLAARQARTSLGGLGSVVNYGGSAALRQLDIRCSEWSHESGLCYSGRGSFARLVFDGRSLLAC